MPSDTSTEASAPRGADIRTFLFADIRGYTRFTQDQGDDAASTLAGRFADLVRDTVPEFEGELLELRGDEALCVFTSPRQALRAAVELQRRLRTGMGGEPAFPLGVGIGVDAGEAVPTRGGYRGASLNVAARLCGRAKSGQVLATESAVHLAGRVVGVQSRPLRQVRLKGLSRPLTPFELWSEDGPSPATGRLGGRRGAGLVVAVVMVVSAVFAGLLVYGKRTGSGSARSALDRLLAEHKDAMAVFDPSGRLLAALPLPYGAGPMVATSSGVWVAASADRRLVRFDAAKKHQLGMVSLPVTPTGLAPASGGGVWVAAGPTRGVALASPGSSSLNFQRQPGCCGGASSITQWSNVVLLSDAAGLHRLDPTTGQSAQTYLRAPVAYAVGAPDATFWASDGWTQLTHLRSQNDTAIRTWHLAPHGRPAELGQMVFGAGRVWEAAPGANAVDVLGGGRPPVRPIRVPSRPSTLAFGAGSVWVGAASDGTVRRIDPGSERLAPGAFRVDGIPTGIAVADGNVWVAVQPLGAAADAPGVIAYDDTSGLTSNLYTIRADGTDRHQLTHSKPGRWAFAPWWSPNGRYIAFSAGPVNWQKLQTRPATTKTRTEVYIMRADGSHIHRLTTPFAHSPYGAFTPMWSPDGRHILYWLGVSTRGYGFGDVWVMNANGRNPHPLTHHHGYHDAYFPSGWTANGKYALYGHYTYNTGAPTTAKFHTNVATLTGRVVARLPDVPTPAGNGTLLALVAPGASGVKNISIADSHGSHPVVVAHHPLQSVNVQPVWSPDQTRLAYAGSWETPTDLIVTRADGSGRTILVGDEATGDPAWRPVP